MLLALLHDRFLSPRPTRPNDAPNFAGLSALVQSRAAAYLHNDREFQSHPRRAIQEQYASLRDGLESWINTEIEEGKVQGLGRKITHTMMTKQIAIDQYFNFPSHLDLMNTFLGLNTVRVDLGPVDLLRSYIVEKATTDKWNASDIEDIENQFTDVFTRDEQPDGELLPFVKVVLDKVRSNNKKDSGGALDIFPSWNTGLERREVDRFLQFVADMKRPSFAGNSYISEIRNCGSNPFAIILAYYYRLLVTFGNSPSFRTGGTEEDADLHHILIACYRVLLDGRIGRTRDYAAYCLDGRYESLLEAANEMSLQFLHIDISTNTDAGWLRSALTRVDKNRAKRVFNAMLLPRKESGFGGSFSPIPFGRRSIEFHIDHLIPESMLVQNSNGYAEATGIRNFAPFPSNQNRIAKATSASTKLAPNGIYDAYIAGTGPVHPYCVWLVRDHASHYQPPQLDNQNFLELNAQPSIGDARLEKVSSELHTRL